MPNSSGLLVIPVTLKNKLKFYVITVLFSILQRNYQYLNKSCIFFGYLLPYIILGFCIHTEWKLIDACHFIMKYVGSKRVGVSQSFINLEILFRKRNYIVLIEFKIPKIVVTLIKMYLN